MHFADCHKNPTAIQILHYSATTMELVMQTTHFLMEDILTRMQERFLQNRQRKLVINVALGEVQRR